MELPIAEGKPPSPIPTAARGLRVLIVDDEPPVRIFLRLMLRKVGVQIAWDAGCCDDALELFRAHRPDVVLLDVNLPYVHGLEILRRLLAIDPDAAVVVVTSDHSGETIAAVQALGVAGYVLKQLPPVEMQRMLSDTLARIEPRIRAGAV